jgi:ribonuclease HII
MFKKKPKPYPDLASEVSLGFFSSKTSIIIGVDEVGRGCLAGTVVAAAAVLCPERVLQMGFLPNGKRGRGFKTSPKNTDHPIRRIQDSKMIPEEDRQMFRDAVKEFAVGFAIGEASVEEIESLNILYASHLAMERAVAKLEAELKIRADWILVDGHIVPKVFLGRGMPLIKGDQKSLSIACASIMAKVYRDGVMQEMEVVYPGYGLKQNKGYPTPYHKRQITLLGPTPIHRRGFKGVILDMDVSELMQEQLFEESSAASSDGFV